MTIRIHCLDGTALVRLLSVNNAGIEPVIGPIHPDGDSWRDLVFDLGSDQPGAHAAAIDWRDAFRNYKSFHCEEFAFAARHFQQGREAGGREP